MLNRRLLALGFFVIVIIAGILLFINYNNSFQKLTVTIEGNQNIQAKMYLASSADGASETSHENTVITTIKNTETVRIKKGIYVIVLPGQSDYKEVKKRVELADEKISITFDPDYTDSKLTALLQQQANDIQQAIFEKYPSMPSLYNINPGKLYKHGDWYATTLIYKDQSDDFLSDTLRLVVQKEDSAWIVVTNPPQIIVSKVVYPDIPSAVVDDINNQ